MRKKILIIGNGAKAYALAKKLSDKHDIFITPESDTLKEFASCSDIREDNITELLDFVMENDIDMTIPTTNKSINSNISSVFSKNKQTVFAPSVKANELITNTSTAKKVFYKLRIPTPKFAIFEKQNIAIDYIKNQKVPFVIKNNEAGSATIVTSIQSAKNIIEYSFINKEQKVIIEDYMYGAPFSFYVLTDGYKALPIGNTLSFKHPLVANGGQLTCGMGIHLPNPKLTISDEYFIMDNIVYPILDYLDIAGTPYSGILGINGIRTDEGNIVALDLSSFLEDCDADAILDSINDDIYSLFESCIIGSFSDEYESIGINDKSYVSAVLTCKNKNNNANIISGMDMLDETTLLSFYPSVRKNKYLEFEANHGPVCSITCSASAITSAVTKLKNEMECINFEAKVYRPEIFRDLAENLSLQNLI